MNPFLVVNPHSAGGWTGRHAVQILAEVRRAIGEVEWAFTRSAGDGARLAADAYRHGRRYVVAVGGDGTASEVIDGLLAAGGGADPALELGFIPHGTGGDLRRSLGLSDRPAEAVAALASAATRTIDVGRVTMAGAAGAPIERHFVNVATCGVSARAAALVNAGRKILPGKLTFFVASARALLGWSDRTIRWRADGGPWREDRITALSCCNGRHFGGGILVAPDARIDDGLFDVVLWKGYGPVDLAIHRPKLYDGRHVLLPKTEVIRARTLELEATDGAPLPIDLDGEQPGFLPARIAMVPGALRVRVGEGPGGGAGGTP